MKKCDCHCREDLGEKHLSDCPVTLRLEAETWLHDTQWRGWLEDQITGQIVTSYGDKFASMVDFVSWLKSLPKWPKIIKSGEGSGRNVPPCELQVEAKQQ